MNEELAEAQEDLLALFEDPDQAIDVLAGMMIDNMSLICLFIGMLEEIDPKSAKERSEHVAQMVKALGVPFSNANTETKNTVP